MFKKKPIPKRKTIIEIKVGEQKQDVEIKTEIVDKRGDSFDREAFLRTLKPISDEDAKPHPTKPPQAKPTPGDAILPEGIPELPEGIPELPDTVFTTKKGKTKKRKRNLAIKGTIVETKETQKVDLGDMEVRGIRIGDTIVNERLGDNNTEIVKMSSYYLTNRQIFLETLPLMFEDYRQQLIEEESEEVTCDQKFGDFSLLTHQKIIRDYINIYSPYRGLLLYHGLGSGKTCSSIAIAEGLKTSKRIVIMTPASLRSNYIKELKFCGDFMYKKKQFWEFIRVAKNSKEAQALSKILNIDITFINEHKPPGAWMVNIKRDSNYDELDSASQQHLDNQLDLMISAKYEFINYNGLRKSHLSKLVRVDGQNPFSNKVVIVDEAHNFVSRIVNKLKRKDSLSMILYEYFKSAENCKIVFLTGTPIINYPNEIAVLFNMLRGYINTFHIPVTVLTSQKIDETVIQTILYKELGIIDTVRYIVSRKELIITRNPFGFINHYDDSNYKGVKIDELGNMSNEQFLELLIKVLEKHNIKPNKKEILIKSYPTLPDDLDEFRSQFINENGEMFNVNKFKRRIVGLTSYFRSAQESLMPSYDPKKDYHIVRIEMSDFQLGVYEEARVSERKLEKSSKKAVGAIVGNDTYESSTSTYRIFSRAFCNYVFPSEIGRPLPRDGTGIDDAISKMDEDALDNASVEQRLHNVDGRFTADQERELEEKKSETTDMTYDQRIQHALRVLYEDKEKYLTTDALTMYSPKFKKMMEILLNSDYIGNHLIYSQFRTIEGIGVLRLVLLANGFAEFKLSNDSGRWKILKQSGDDEKPKFVLYTGTETHEEKEIIRNIFNGKWGEIPDYLNTELLEIHENNNYGEIIKVFMITSAGAEGIDLKNVRYVHLTEPYWHPVRLEQVVGRARRICSHDKLSKEHRTVEVFLYLMTFSDRQIKELCSIELKINDISKLDKKTALTSDEMLNEISNIKQDVNKQLLHSIKETSIDCSIYNNGRENPEKLDCFTFTTSDVGKIAYNPSISQDEDDAVAKVNKKSIKWKAKLVNIQGTRYAYRNETQEIYDLMSYMNAVKGEGDPLKIGTLVTDATGNIKLRKV